MSKGRTIFFRLFSDVTEIWYRQNRISQAYVRILRKYDESKKLLWSSQIKRHPVGCEPKSRMSPIIPISCLKVGPCTEVVLHSQNYIMFY